MNFLEYHICHLYHALSSKEIPQNWLETGAHHLGQLLAALWTAMLGADKQLVSNLYSRQQNCLDVWEFWMIVHQIYTLI